MYVVRLRPGTGLDRGWSFMGWRGVGATPKFEKSQSKDSIQTYRLVFLFENRPLVDFQIRNGHVWRPAASRYGSVLGSGVREAALAQLGERRAIILEVPSSIRGVSNF